MSARPSSGHRDIEAEVKYYTEEIARRNKERESTSMTEARVIPPFQSFDVPISTSGILYSLPAPLPNASPRQVESRQNPIGASLTSAAQPAQPPSLGRRRGPVRARPFSIFQSVIAIPTSQLPRVDSAHRAHSATCQRVDPLRLPCPSPFSAGRSPCAWPRRPRPATCSP